MIKSLYYLKLKTWHKMMSFFLLAAASLAGIYQSEAECPLNGIGIIIDAGHGGIDSGAEYNGIKEKELNLALSLNIGSKLRDAGAKVFFTREDDVDYYTRGKGGKRNDLLKRIELIESSEAALFLSIHCNASADKRWHGAQVYYNPANPANCQLAKQVQQALRDFDSANKRSEKADAKILLLKNAAKPGVLVETGFISNEREADMLKNPASQDKIADSIVRGIIEYVAAAKDKNV